MSDPTLAPIATGIASVIVAALGATGLIIRRRQDARDAKSAAKTSKEITEKDGYAEVRLARAEASRYYTLYREFQEVYFVTMTALRHLVRKLHESDPEFDLPQEIVDALELKAPDDDDK
jgi:hypothetical protein